MVLVELDSFLRWAVLLNKKTEFWGYARLGPRNTETLTELSWILAPHTSLPVKSSFPCAKSSGREGMARRWPKHLFRLYVTWWISILALYVIPMTLFNRNESWKIKLLSQYADNCAYKFEHWQGHQPARLPHSPLCVHSVLSSENVPSSWATDISSWLFSKMFGYKHVLFLIQHHYESKICKLRKN